MAFVSLTQVTPDGGPSCFNYPACVYTPSNLGATFDNHFSNLLQNFDVSGGVVLMQTGFVFKPMRHKIGFVKQMLQRK